MAAAASSISLHTPDSYNILIFNFPTVTSHAPGLLMHTLNLRVIHHV
jgi:hypothetical protein